MWQIAVQGNHKKLGVLGSLVIQVWKIQKKIAGNGALRILRVPEEAFTSNFRHFKVRLQNSEVVKVNAFTNPRLLIVPLH